MYVLALYSYTKESTTMNNEMRGEEGRERQIYFRITHLSVNPYG